MGSARTESGQDLQDRHGAAGQQQQKDGAQGLGHGRHRAPGLWKNGSVHHRSNIHNHVHTDSQEIENLFLYTRLLCRVKLCRIEKCARSSRMEL